MIPILYPADEAKKGGSAFRSNGLGGLGDAISCVVTEEKNGMYELEMEYPVTGRHFSDLENDKLIYAKPNETSTNQIFRIYAIEKPIDGVVNIHAEHISYLLSKAICLPFEAGSAAGAFDQIRSKLQWNTSNPNFPNFPFTFWTDSTLSGHIKIEKPTSVKAALGGQEGSIIDGLHGGEYEFDNFQIKLYQQRGHDNHVTLRYGKNITDLTQSDDMSEVYTGILPYWSGSLSVTEDLPDADMRVVTNSVDTMIYITQASQAKYKTTKSTTNYVNGNTLWSTKVTNFAYPMAKPVDLSSDLDLGEEEEIKEEQGKDEDDYSYALRVIGLRQKHEKEWKAHILEVLTAAANEYLTNNTGWVPSNNLEVSFVQLWNSEEYKNVAVLERVSMGDIVSVYYPKINVSTKLRVVKTEYNVLMDRFNSVELGDSKSTAADTINNRIGDATLYSDKANQDLINALKKTKSDLAQAIDYATSLLTGNINDLGNEFIGFTGALGGHVVFNRNAAGHVNEILIMDTSDKNTAKYVVRMNLAGIGFSTHGYNGPFETAWTIDGKFNADWITTGVLTAVKIQTASTGKRIIINQGDATVAGWNNNQMMSVIDMVSDKGGTMLIDSSTSMAIRTPRILVSTVSQGDNEGDGTVTITTSPSTYGYPPSYTVTGPFVTDVSKYMSWDHVDRAPEQKPQELWLADVGEDAGSVYCTLPALIKVKYGGAFINGLLVGNTTDRIYAF